MCNFLSARTFCFGFYPQEGGRGASLNHRLDFIISVILCITLAQVREQEIPVIVLRLFSGLTHGETRLLFHGDHHHFTASIKCGIKCTAED